MVGAAAETGMPLVALKALGVNQPAHALDGVALDAVHRAAAGGRTLRWPTTKWKWCRHSWRAWSAQGTAGSRRCDC